MMEEVTVSAYLDEDIQIQNLMVLFVECFVSVGFFADAVVG